MSLGRFGAMVAAAALACAGPVRADYAAGKAAWDAGRPAAALAEWRAAADGGDRQAMLSLGRLYAKGLGAPQDFVLAHMWFNLAASRGEAAALEERDALAAKMTPAALAEAQKRARDWRPGGAAAAPKPAAEAAPDAGPPPPRAIREAQSLLAGLGYDPGPADGKWGARTGKAYRAFLRDAGRPASDALTPEDLRALRAAAEGAGGAPPPPEARIRTDAAALAASRGDIDGLKAALAAGADPDARDDRGWTALMHAANEGYSLVVPPLLAAKADPDVRAPDGATALFIATVRGHTEIVSLLSKADADVSIRGPQGKTAVDAARARYGDPAAAREKGEVPAILALLEGKTLAEVARERAKAEEEERKRTAKFKRLVDHWRDTPWLFERDCPECPEMVLVPAGSFTMGSPASEEGRYDNEGPVHRVRIPEPFAVGKYEVTRGEFARFVSATGHDTGSSCWTREGGKWKNRSGWSWRSPGYSQTERDPAVCVSWEDARSYARWLSGKTGKEYRLLSESEWEYAARAGTTTRYYWGNAIGRNRANCNGCGSRWDNEQTAPVGSFAANGFGLHDMHGNVWEWVEDCWNDDYAGAPSDGSAWESGNCARRVLRGGSWSGDPRYLRAANRGRSDTGFRSGSLGFRVARTLTP